MDVDALLACECELNLDPVCVDLGVGMTFPAPNACVAECLALPVVEGGECMNPEALDFWLAFFEIDPSDVEGIDDVEELLEELFEDLLNDAEDDAEDDDWNDWFEGDSLDTDSLEGDWHPGGHHHGGHHGGNCSADNDDDDEEEDDAEVEEVMGCMAEDACNYNPEATVEDESCDFTSCLVFGCDDVMACKYDTRNSNVGAGGFFLCQYPALDRTRDRTSLATGRAFSAPLARASSIWALSAMSSWKRARSSANPSTRASSNAFLAWPHP